MNNKKLNFFEQILEKYSSMVIPEIPHFSEKLNMVGNSFYLSWSDWMDVMYNVEFSEEFLHIWVIVVRCNINEKQRPAKIPQTIS